MADLGNLWFSLGLDDKKFQQEWDNAFKKFQEKAKIKVDVLVDQQKLQGIVKYAEEYGRLVAALKNSSQVKIDMAVSDSTIQALTKLKEIGASDKQWAAMAKAATAAGKYAKELEKTKREATKTAIEQEKLKKAAEQTAAVARESNAKISRADSRQAVANANAEAMAQRKITSEKEKQARLDRESNAKISRQNSESRARIARQDSESRAKINNRNEESLKRQESIQARIKNILSGTNQTYQRQSLWLQNINSLVSNYFSLYGIKNFVSELARVTGEFEKQRVTLQAMVGEMEGLEIFGKMKQLAIVSPFEFKDLVSYARQLAAFSIPYSELYDTTKKLADVSAGLGVDMSRIILAYGQIKSAGVLKGCLGKDTFIKTTHGVKAVQDITVGDVLFNERGELVNVLELIRGKEQMYLIKQSVGDNYRVNENHILTLWDNCTNELVDIYVKDYLKEPERYLGYKITAQKEWSTYSISIEKDIEDDYYGFVLDGNKRFQLADGTITHNTELRQLTEAGVPILDKLAKKIEVLKGEAVSIGDIFGMISQKMIPFKMVAEVFDELTQEGGQFYEMQAIQSQTLAGKISNLKDAYAIMLSEIGQRTNGLLSGGVAKLYDWIKNWERLGKVIASVAAGFAIFQVMRIGQHMFTGLLSLIQAFKNLKTSSDGAGKSIGKALMSPGGAALVGVLSTVVVYLYQCARAAGQFKREIKEILSTQTSELEGEIETFNRLSQAITEATEGTEKRREAIDEFNKRFGQYLDNAIKEANANEAIAASYDKITTSIQNRYKEEALLRAKNAVQEKYGKKVDEQEEDFIQTLKTSNLTKEGRYAIAAVKRVLDKNMDADYWTDVYAEFKEAFNDPKGTGLAHSMALAFDEYFKDFKNAYEDYAEKMDEIKQKTDEAFDVETFSTYKIEQQFKEYTAAYEKAVEKIKDNSKLSRDDVNKALQEEEIKYLTKITELYKDLPQHLKKYKLRLEELTRVEDKWRVTIKDIAKEFNVSDFFTPQKTEDYLEYIKKIREEYKSLKESIVDLQGSDPEGFLGTLENRKKFIEKVASEFGFSLEDKKKSGRNPALEKLKTDYQSLKAAYDIYNDLIKNFNSREAVTLMGKSISKNKFYNQIKSALGTDGGVEEYFLSMFEQIQEDAIKKGGDAGVAFAESITNALNKEDKKTIEAAVKLVENAQEELAKWGLEDFTLQGTGFAFDISKILREQTVNNNKVYAKRKELLDQITRAEAGNAMEVAALRMKFGDEWAKKAREQIEELTELEIENNRKIAQEKINNLAEAVAKEQLSKIVGEGFMQSMSDKTLTQLKEALAKIQSTEISEGVIKSLMTDQEYEEFQAKLAAMKLTLNDFIIKIKEYMALQGKDVSATIFKKTKDQIKNLSSTLGGMIDSLRQLSNGDGLFSGLLDGLKLGTSMVPSLVDAFNWKEMEDGSKILEVNWTSIASAAATLVTNIISSIAASREYARQMRLANEEFTRSIVESGREMEITGEKFETIFGENIIGALKADSKAITSIVNELKNASYEVANMKIKTKQKGWFLGSNTYMSLKDFAPQLFKADGTVNYKYLDEFLGAYGDKLSDSQKALLEHLKTTYEQYEDAMADVNDYLSGIFSDTASTIADRMIEAFAVTGNAATELGDMVNGIAKQMAKDLIQSLLIEQYLTPAMDRVKNLYDTESKSYEADPTVRIQKSILAMREGLEQAETGAAEVTKILQGLADYGIDFSQDAENGSDVLSGLTEAQQNLLMGYINGIRADVSYNKAMMSSIVNSVGTISNNVADAIIVWKQIEANTHRSADGVDRIIGFFESVMGPYDGGGGQAFKVNIA